MRTIEQDMVLVQMKGRVQGPFQVKLLRKLPGFTGQTLVSYPGTDKWAPAYRVLLNINSYEPPMAYTSVVSESPVEWTAPAPAAAFDWKAKRIPGAWVDKWFRRIVVFNLFLAIGAYAAWSSPKVRIPLQNELQRQWSDQELRWGPVPIRVVRYHPSVNSHSTRPA